MNIFKTLHISGLFMSFALMASCGPSMVSSSDGGHPLHEIRTREGSKYFYAFPLKSGEAVSWSGGRDANGFSHGRGAEVHYSREDGADVLSHISIGTYQHGYAEGEVSVLNIRMGAKHTAVYQKGQAISNSDFTSFSQSDRELIREYSGETKTEGRPEQYPAELSNTFDRVAVVISEILGVQQSQIMPSHDLFKDLGADSLDAVEIVMAIEEEFEIKLSDEYAENITTVGDIVRYLSSVTQR